MKHFRLFLIAIISIANTACSYLDQRVPKEILRFAIEDFEREIFSEDIMKTFSMYSGDDYERTVDYSRSIEVHVESLNDYFLLEFCIGQEYYEGLDILPYNLYRTDRALYTIFEDGRQPSSQVISELKERNMLHPHVDPPLPRRWMDCGSGVVYYFICKQDPKKFHRRKVAYPLMRTDFLKSPCE